jgi:predicted transcriptional regulator
MTERPPSSDRADAMTLKIPGDLAADVARIAETTGRSANSIVLRAIRIYLMNEGADILAYRRGLDEIAAGEVEDIDDVIADMDRIARGDD